MDINPVRAILRKIAFFDGLDDEMLDLIYFSAKAITVDEGGVIFRQGDQGDGMYLIISGKVEISQFDEGGYKTILATLGASSVIGEMAILDNLPRSASAQAIERTTMFHISSRDFELLLENNFPITLKILNTLTKRLRDGNNKLVEKRRRRLNFV